MLTIQRAINDYYVCKQEGKQERHEQRRTHVPSFLAFQYSASRRVRGYRRTSSLLIITTLLHNTYIIIIILYRLRTWLSLLASVPFSFLAFPDRRNTPEKLAEQAFAFGTLVVGLFAAVFAPGHAMKNPYN